MRGSSPRRGSPSGRLLLGLVITMAAVVVYSWYVSRQIGRLRELQSGTMERTRKDSLQLLRVQNALNSLAIAMRDMSDATEPYPLTAWEAQFERIRTDLEDALGLEAQLAASRTDQREFLAESLAQFWDATGRMFDLARAGKEREAREHIRLTLQPRQSSLTAAVARLLAENYEREEQVAQDVRAIYDRVERQVYVFLGATLLAVGATGAYFIRSNRRLFAQVDELSRQRSELAQNLIATQESTLRHVSRELHDEFGQVLTAIGAILARSTKHADSGLRTDLREASEITQATLDKVRSLSQALHPVILDEAGLENALDWYLPTVSRQSGMEVKYERAGTPFPFDGDGAVHVYRVLQEALNNAARHSGAQQVFVRMKYLPDRLELEVEDHGAGIPEDRRGRSIGLVAMRERAELLGGGIEFLRPNSGGTLVRLTVPRPTEANR